VITLPVFYAVDLTRLPPTDVKHCDMSAVITELQALRNEMIDMKRLQKEVDGLRDQLHNIQTHSHNSISVHQPRSTYAY